MMLASRLRYALLFVLVSGPAGAAGPVGEVRSLDGSGNHLGDGQLNAAGAPLARSMTSAYGDGAHAMAGAERPSPRSISNLVAAQDADLPNSAGTSDFLWQWGQFVDHDIDLTEGATPAEMAPIAVPPGDPFFDPAGAGDAVIAFQRSIYSHGAGVDPNQPRQQLNMISGWIDASHVYGSGAVRAAALRENDGSGQLRAPGALLPWNTEGLPNADGGSPEPMFLAGDVRANEQVGLTALHTLFVREHNRVAHHLAARYPRLGGEEIYQRARRRVGALVQAITYREFLPALLGKKALPRYRGYAPWRSEPVANAFSTAAYRFGHSMLSPTLLRLDRRLEPIPEGHLPLRDAFFTPQRIVSEGGIEPLLRGLAHQLHQRVDGQLVDAVRNFLFGAPGAGGFDLAALNIQRGRDHGLPDYNAARIAYGLAPAQGWSDISSDPDAQARLAAAYAHIDDVDLWVGGLAEDAFPGSHLGPLFHGMVIEQFVKLRDGDRFWYERALSPMERRRVKRTRLSDVIRRNTDIKREIPRDVFRVKRAYRR